MANFNTHCAYGVVLSGMGASICYASQICDLPTSVGLWGVGILGSLLPDIDSDNALVVKMFFNGIAAVVMAILMTRLAPHLTMLGLWVLLGTAFVLIRFPLMWGFKKFTVHRGVFHSILAALFFCVLFTAVSHHFFNQSALNSWLIGIFVFIGYILHLSLDEIYSVDLTNVRVKRSFGSALKLFSLNYYGRSISMALLSAALITQVPSVITPVQQVLHRIEHVPAAERYWIQKAVLVVQQLSQMD